MPEINLNTAVVLNGLWGVSRTIPFTNKVISSSAATTRRVRENSNASGDERSLFVSEKSLGYRKRPPPVTFFGLKYAFSTFRVLPEECAFTKKHRCGRGLKDNHGTDDRLLYHEHLKVGKLISRLEV